MTFRLARFLFQYRLTPHSTTGQSPAELLLGRKPRSHLDFLFPSLPVEHRVGQLSQERQKEDHDRNASHRAFVVGERGGGSPKLILVPLFAFSVHHTSSPKLLQPPNLTPGDDAKAGPMVCPAEVPDQFFLDDPPALINPQNVMFYKGRCVVIMYSIVE